jgi:branched-chain amino acid aminotransferase
VVQETEKIWMNGELVDWADAKVHVGVHGLHYGSGVFEGIRCYDTPKGPAVFRLGEHMQRLHNSARLLYMQIPYSVDELKDATHELVGANGLPECYLRPIAFYGYGQLGVAARSNPVETVIMSWPWGSYLGEEGMRHGIRAKISSWQRVSPNIVPHVSKASGVYLNSMLAVTEANNAGYDEAILLTPEGTVADGSGENIFVVRDGVIYTPDLATGILPGITRDTVMQIAQDLGYSVVEKTLIRSDLYLADEVFMCGTAAEVTPLRSVDDHEIGAGEVTLQIQKAYLDTVRGQSERWGQWLDHVPQLARGSTSATRSSCSRCSARAGCRSGRPDRASSRCWRTRSAPHMPLPSHRGRPACTSACVSPASAPATRSSPRRTPSSPRRTARFTRGPRRCSRTSTRTRTTSIPRLWRRRSRPGRRRSSRSTSSATRRSTTS